MVTSLFMKELAQIPVKPSCGRNFAKMIIFLVNSDGALLDLAEPHCKEYRAIVGCGAVRAVTGDEGMEEATGNREQKAGVPLAGPPPSITGWIVLLVM